MSITIGPDSIVGNSDWQLRVSGSTVVEKIYNSILGGNENGPAFVYHGNNGWTYFTASTWNELNATRWGSSGSLTERGRGSYGFDTSTCRYYAPVTGYYYIHGDQYSRCETNSTNNYIHFGIGRNGSMTWNNSRHPYQIAMHGNKRGATAAYPSGPTCSGIVYMSEGQYVSLFSYKGNSTQSRFYGAHSFICGHLIS